MKRIKTTLGLTLDEAWVRCHRMWRWVYDEIRHDPGSLETSDSLKSRYLGKTLDPDRYVAVSQGCWFCEYCQQKNFEQGVVRACPNPTHLETRCSNCPGRLLDPTFNCQDLKYHWMDEPVKFYNKIRRMYAQYKRQGG